MKKGTKEKKGGRRNRSSSSSLQCFLLHLILSMSSRGSINFENPASLPLPPSSFSPPSLPIGGMLSTVQRGSFAFSSFFFFSPTSFWPKVSPQQRERERERERARRRREERRRGEERRARAVHYVHYGSVLFALAGRKKRRRERSFLLLPSPPLFGTTATVVWKEEEEGGEHPMHTCHDRP